MTKTSPAAQGTDALALAVIAYDEARRASHGSNEPAMSDRNKETIAPMILAAVTAFNAASPSPEALPASGVEAQLAETKEALKVATGTLRFIAQASPTTPVILRAREAFDHIAALTSAPAPEDRTREAAAIKLADGYGVVLAMIAAGCSDPQRFAKRMLAEYAPEAKKLEITK